MGVAVRADARPLRICIDNRGPTRSRAARRSYLVFFPCLVFAHLARCAAAIFALAAADIFRAPVVADVSDSSPLIFAHRALWAAAILARPVVLNRPLLRVPVLLTYDPANAASAALSPSNCLATRSRSDFKIATMSKFPPEGSNCSRHVETYIVCRSCQ
jgi:hypothetical protein